MGDSKEHCSPDSSKSNSSEDEVDSSTGVELTIRRTGDEERRDSEATTRNREGVQEPRDQERELSRHRVTGPLSIPNTLNVTEKDPIVSWEEIIAFFSRSLQSVSKKPDTTALNQNEALNVVANEKATFCILTSNEIEQGFERTSMKPLPEPTDACHPFEACKELKLQGAIPCAESGNDNQGETNFKKLHRVSEILAEPTEIKQSEEFGETQTVAKQAVSLKRLYSGEGVQSGLEPGCKKMKSVSEETSISGSYTTSQSIQQTVPEKENNNFSFILESPAEKSKLSSSKIVSQNLGAPIVEKTQKAYPETMIQDSVDSSTDERTRKHNTDTLVQDSGAPCEVEKARRDNSETVTQYLEGSSADEKLPKKQLETVTRDVEGSSADETPRKDHSKTMTGDIESSSADEKLPKDQLETVTRNVKGSSVDVKQQKDHLETMTGGMEDSSADEKLPKEQSEIVTRDVEGSSADETPRKDLSETMTGGMEGSSTDEKLPKDQLETVTGDIAGFSSNEKLPKEQSETVTRDMEGSSADENPPKEQLETETKVVGDPISDENIQDLPALQLNTTVGGTETENKTVLERSLGARPKTGGSNSPEPRAFRPTTLSLEHGGGSGASAAFGGARPKPSQCLIGARDVLGTPSPRNETDHEKDVRREVKRFFASYPINRRLLANIDYEKMKTSALFDDEFSRNHGLLDPKALPDTPQMPFMAAGIQMMKAISNYRKKHEAQVAKSTRQILDQYRDFFFSDQSQSDNEAVSSSDIDSFDSNVSSASRAVDHKASEIHQLMRNMTDLHEHIQLQTNQAAMTLLRMGIFVDDFCLYYRLLRHTYGEDVDYSDTDCFVDFDSEVEEKINEMIFEKGISELHSLYKDIMKKKLASTPILEHILNIARSVNSAASDPAEEVKIRNVEPEEAESLSEEFLDRAVMDSDTDDEISDID